MSNTWSLSYRNKHLAKGANALCKDDPRLKAKWKWGMHDIAYDGMTSTKRARCPGQLSEADLGNDFTLSVIDWSDHFEATLEYGGDTFCSTGAFGAGWKCETLKTRLEAQIHAEKLKGELIEILRRL